MNTKCIVIMSGGPDSVTAAYWAKKQGYDVHLITFNYGQKAQIEIKIAKQIAEKLECPQKIVDLSNLKEIYEGVTSLVDNDLDVSSDFTDPIIVPFRNGVFLAVATAFADAIGAKKIFYGAHKSDAPFYPDCRKEFYKAFEKAAKLGTDHQIEIDAPFSNIPKSEIFKKASELNVPLQDTWSCYLNGPYHCGKCESCNNRKTAFKDSGIGDKTKYKE